MKIDAYVAGTQTFDQFAKESRKDWVKLARYLMRGGRLAADVTEDDVVQELLTGCWIGMQKYDPTRQSANQYAVFQAMSRAKKRFKNLRRYRLETVCEKFDLLEEVGEDLRALRELTYPADQGAELERVQRLELLMARCQRVIEMQVLEIFYRREDAKAVARELYASANMRRVCQFGSEQTALRKVLRVLKEQAARSAER
jgi:hypothetical protein